MDWSPSYNKGKVTPFGSQLLYESLPDLFPGQQITNTKVAPNKALREFEAQRSNYVIFAEELDIKQADAKALLDFARRGNSVFVAADVFDGPFADSLGIENRSDFIRILRMSVEENVGKQACNSPRPTSASAIPSIPCSTTCPTASCPTPFGAEVLSTDEERHAPSSLRFQIGEGQVLVHAIPLAFTNYYMVDPVNHDYISQVPLLPARAAPDLGRILQARPRADGVQRRLHAGAARPALCLDPDPGHPAPLHRLSRASAASASSPSRSPSPTPPSNSPRPSPGSTTATPTTRTSPRKKIKFFLEYVRNRWMLPTLALNEEFQLRLAAKSGHALPRGRRALPGHPRRAETSSPSRPRPCSS